MSVIKLHADVRFPSLLRAEIIYNNDSMTVDCVVRSISAREAKIELDNASSLPTDFILHVPHKNDRYHARIVRRQAEALEVTFIPSETPAVIGQRLENQIARLQHENGRLVTIVGDLTKRLSVLSRLSEEPGGSVGPTPPCPARS